LYLGPNISKSFTICRCSLITAATNRRWCKEPRDMC
jgi:hypothetical protein